MELQYESGVLKVDKLYDASTQNRYGPHRIVSSTVPIITPATQKKLEEQDTKRVNDVIQMTENELRDLDILVPKIQEFISSESNRRYIKGLLAAGSTEEQVSGLLVENVLTSILRPDK